MPPAPPADAVDALRRFNRFYTQQIGVLHEGLVQSPWSLTEARVLYELAQRSTIAASELARDLTLDAGYLSRILRRFEDAHLVKRQPSLVDARQSQLTLTATGRKAVASLEDASRCHIAALLQPLSNSDRQRLLGALATVQGLLGPADKRPAAFLLRPHRPGDLGHVVSRHGALYAEEYGWDIRFEAMVAGIAQHFLEHFDPARECCWIAERDGAVIGSVVLARKDDATAKLRLLLVEPSARGLGLGRRLTQECTRFARRAGYARITLWTNSILLAARQIYRDEGYVLTESAPYHGFGQDLVGETWELVL